MESLAMIRLDARSKQSQPGKDDPRDKRIQVTPELRIAAAIVAANTPNLDVLDGELLAIAYKFNPNVLMDEAIRILEQ